MNPVRTVALLALPLAVCAAQTSGATTSRVFNVRYVATGVRAGGLQIVEGEICTGETAETFGVAGVPDEGGACFATGGRLHGTVTETVADVSVSDALGNAVGGFLRFGDSGAGEVRFCGSITGVPIPAGTRFVSVDLVAEPGSGCGIATTGTITLTLT